MTTLAHLRKTALSLPEVEEVAAGELISFAVAGREFASVTSDRSAVELRLGADDAAAMLDAHQSAEQVARGRTTASARITLADLDGQELNHWVRRAWLANAPKRLSDAARAADAARAGEVGDLPKSIGNPATRALVAAGLTSLADVRAYGVERLADLHGVGPKAIAILRPLVG